jgi:hypothetical protein
MLTRVQAFEALRGNLEITGLQEKTVADRQSKIRAAVGRKLTVTDSFLTGSYRRNTMISPLKQADVDVMVVLDRGYRQRGEPGSVRHDRRRPARQRRRPDRVHPQRPLRRGRRTGPAAGQRRPAAHRRRHPARPDRPPSPGLRPGQRPPPLDRTSAFSSSLLLLFFRSGGARQAGRAGESRYCRAVTVACGASRGYGIAVTAPRRGECSQASMSGGTIAATRAW